jgi:hypothetical protein
MAKTPRTRDDSAAHVAEEALPGWKAVKETSLDEDEQAGAATDAFYEDAAKTADAVMPSLDRLKAKYLGASGTRSDAMPDAAEAAAAAQDTALVEMESGPLKKTVAVSKSKKKVIWSQG